MLNGIDPLLVIVLKKRPPEDIMGPPLPPGLFDEIGVPIPIYLSERLTKIYVDSESRSIDVQTKVEPVTETDPLTGDTKRPEVTQTALDTQVSINLLATKDSILLTALIALMETIISRLVSREYSINYINGPTVIFGALLHRFATSINPNEDKVQIELTLSTAAKEAPTPKTPIQAVGKVTGAVPL